MAYLINRGLWERHPTLNKNEKPKGWLSVENISYEIKTLPDDAVIDLANAKCYLVTDDATKTFVISHSGDVILIELVLNTTSSVFTFPAGSLCAAEGVASGDNTLTLSGTSGDKYLIAIEKGVSNYYISSKNFGQ